MSNSQFGETKPEDPREVCRFFAIRVGRIPDLSKGQGVWVLHQNRWCRSKAVRRLPGGMWWCVVEAGRYASERVIVSCNSWGGVIDAN